MFLAALLASQWSIYYRWFMTVCLSSNYFQIATLPTILSDSYDTWHKCFMCQCAQNCGTDFQNFACKIFGEFVKFCIWS